MLQHLRFTLCSILSNQDYKIKIVCIEFFLAKIGQSTHRNIRHH